MTMRRIMRSLAGVTAGTGVLALSLWAIAADWGKPLGGTYDGADGKPRPVAPAPAELSPDERATMAVFERATKSVVFIA
ncbi:MAG: hypothetical protein AAB433_19165, partial [Nitrospirota bacterium]